MGASAYERPGWPSCQDENKTEGSVQGRRKGRHQEGTEGSSRRAGEGAHKEEDSTALRGAPQDDRREVSGGRS